MLGNGNIRLEVRPQVSEFDNANGVTAINGKRVPGLRTRWVDTAVEMKAGQTLALAGLIQTRDRSPEPRNPLAGRPALGRCRLPSGCRRQKNEIELVVTVRPELVDALDPQEVPTACPVQQTTSPNDWSCTSAGTSKCPIAARTAVARLARPVPRTGRDGESMIPAGEPLPVPTRSRSAPLKSRRSSSIVPQTPRRCPTSTTAAAISKSARPALVRRDAS